MINFITLFISCKPIQKCEENLRIVRGIVHKKSRGHSPRDKEWKEEKLCRMVRNFGEIECFEFFTEK